MKCVTISANCKAVEVEGSMLVPGACKQERDTGNAESANGTKSPLNSCEFLE